MAFIENETGEKSQLLGKLTSVLVKLVQGRRLSRDFSDKLALQSWRSETGMVI